MVKPLVFRSAVRRWAARLHRLSYVLVSCMIEYSEPQLMSKLPGVSGKQTYLFLLLLNFQTA